MTPASLDGGANPGPILPFGIALFDLEQENKFLIFRQHARRRNTVREPWSPVSITR